MGNFQKAAETITPSNTNEYPFTTIEMGDTRYPTLAVDTFTKSTAGNLTITCEYSFDKYNWYKIKLPSASATSWSKVYSADASSEFLSVYDSTPGLLIPVMAPFSRFVVQLASFAGSPSIIAREGAMQL